MRRLLSFFAFFAFFAFGLSSAAWADVTLRYKMIGGDNGPTMRVMADDGGDVRIQAFGPDGRSLGGLLTSGGVSYLVGRDGNGLFVARQDDLVAIATQMMTSAGARQGVAMMRGVFGGDYQVSEGGPATVAGRQGMVYRIAPAAAGQATSIPPIEIVMSRDADLAPVGRELGRLMHVSTGMMNAFLGATPNMIARIEEVLGHGTPLKAGPLTLDSVSADPLPAAMFALPAPALTREQLMARFMPARPAPPPAGAAPPAAPAEDHADHDDADHDDDADTDDDDHDDDDGPDPQ